MEHTVRYLSAWLFKESPREPLPQILHGLPERVRVTGRGNRHDVESWAYHESKMGIQRDQRPGRARKHS